MLRCYLYAALLSVHEQTHIYARQALNHSINTCYASELKKFHVRKLLTLLSTYTLPAFKPFVLSAYAYHTISIKHLHALRVELKLLTRLQENRSLQLTGDVMAKGEAIITGELMATGEAEIQSVQTTRDGGIVASQDRHFVCWPSS